VKLRSPPMLVRMRSPIEALDVAVVAHCPEHRVAATRGRRAGRRGKVAP
jgi:hypothetical protein